MGSMSSVVGGSSENNGSRGAASADGGGRHLPELPILRHEPEMFDLSTPPVPLSTSADGGGLGMVGHREERGVTLPLGDSWMSGA
eukprot:6736785-Alexandrium_andersonii.AAC.1